MRLKTKCILSSCLLLAISWTSQAQDIPGSFGGVPASQAVGAATAAAPAVAAAPKNIWSFICRTKEQKEACREKFCKSAPGKLINGLLKPVSAATGGLIGPLCPDPSKAFNKEDLLKPADSAQGAAAKIKAEEAQAKARMEAVQYLGTVDCRYYPEAEAALINALRGDKTECVRSEAAKALSRGCCCTSKIVKALTIVVNCSDEDGFPAEHSELVIAYAYVALDRCLRSCMSMDAAKPPESPPAKEPDEIKKTEAILKSDAAQAPSEIQLAFYGQLQRLPKTSVYASAKQALSRGLKLSRETLVKLNRPSNLKTIVTDSYLPTLTVTENAEPPQVATAPIAEEKNSPITETKTAPRSLMSIFREAANPENR
jgi:hypothetical protein